MISPTIAGNDSRCGIALRVFLRELSAISCQYPHPNSELPVKRCFVNFSFISPLPGRTFRKQSASSTGRCNTI
jgi:hypothetical protein